MALCMKNWNCALLVKSADLKFGKWSVQANKQSNMHGCNEVWGSLRLAPMRSLPKVYESDVRVCMQSAFTLGAKQLLLLCAKEMTCQIEVG